MNAPMAWATDRPAGGDAAGLAETVRQSVASRTKREVLHLRLSRLWPRLAREHHQRLLREAVEPMLRPIRGALFQLPNGDLVATAPPGGAQFEAAATRLATLLEDAAASGLIARYRLPEDAPAVFQALEAGLLPEPESVEDSRPAGADVLDVRRLASLERALAGTGIAAYLRERPVWRLGAPGETPVAAWDLVEVDATALCGAMLPDVTATGAPTLQPALDGAIERRLLAELGRRGAGAGPVALRLRLRTVLHPAFLRFDARLGAAGRAAVVIALSAAEAVAAPADFALVRRLLCARGYRTLVDVSTPALCAVLPPARLGCDYVRLPFSAELASAGLPAGVAPDRLVLAAADRTAAIGWGWEAGVSLFESRLLQALPR